MCVKSIKAGIETLLTANHKLCTVFDLLTVCVYFYINTLDYFYKHQVVYYCLTPYKTCAFTFLHATEIESNPALFGCEHVTQYSINEKPVEASL